MSTPAAPKVSRDRAFSLVWVVPIIALAIGGWMVFRELHKRGPVITIEFADGSGIEEGKTVLEYKGVEAGQVEGVHLKPGLDSVIVRLRLHKSAAALAAADSRFWIVHPEIGFSGVRGLDTLISGVHLNVLPGKKPPAEHFRGLDQPPPPEVVDEGRSFILRADRLGSLTTGAPVFYREFKVGSVETSHLADDSTAVLIRVHINGPYADLVRANTQFWNAGGFDFKVSLFRGAELKDTSLESLVTGGVAFATPDLDPPAPAAPAYKEFILADEAQKEWLKWSPRIAIQPADADSTAKPKSPLLNDLIKH